MCFARASLVVTSYWAGEFRANTDDKIILPDLQNPL